MNHDPYLKNPQFNDTFKFEFIQIVCKHATPLFANMRSLIESFLEQNLQSRDMPEKTEYPTQTVTEESVKVCEDAGVKWYNGLTIQTIHQTFDLCVTTSHIFATIIRDAMLGSFPFRSQFSVDMKLRST